MKIPITNRTFFLSLAIGLTILGIILISIGGYEIKNADSTASENTEISLYNPPADKPVTFYINPRLTESFSNVHQIAITFNTTQVFAGDVISYHAVADVPNSTAINFIVMAIISPQDNTTGIDQNNAYTYFSKLDDLGHVITLSPNSNPPFTTDGMINVPNEQQLSLFGIIFMKNAMSTIKSTGNLLNVYPSSEKLQAQTNKAVLEEIKQFQQNNKAQNKTNAIAEGLTWVIVGWLPLGFACEIFLSIYLRK